MTNSTYGIIADKDDISAVGHRVVHGGEKLQQAAVITKEVLTEIVKHVPLAPLHNPANIMGIEVATEVFSKAPQIAVFDTAFHQTMPPYAFLYALPYEMYTKHKIRRYGFHGTSHAYISEEAAKYLDKPLTKTNLITIHLGNGASMAAVKNGQCIDTTMGLTPLAGLVMGTRTGDLDPAVPFYLADHLKMSLTEIDMILNKESGLKGLCGSNDMREVLEKNDAGDERAQNALRLYTYRVKKYIGSYFAALGRVDAVLFTAGVGENSAVIRKLCCQDLEVLGIEMDEAANDKGGKGIVEISKSHSPVKVLVVPTNEELKIAMECLKLL